MELKIIRTKKQYQEYLDWVDKQLDKKVKPDSPQGEKVQVALLLIKQYEDLHYPIPVPDPIEVIKLKMQDLGLKNKDELGINLVISKCDPSQRNIIDKAKQFKLEQIKQY